MNEFKDENDVIDNLVGGGIFTVTHIRNGKVIGVDKNHNRVVTQGLTNLIARCFSTQPQEAMYLAVFSSNYTPIAGDTAATFATLSNEFTGYDETTRPLYNCVVVGAQANNTSNKATFTFNSPATLYGCSLSTNSSKSSTLGDLIAANNFNTPRTVIAGDILTIEYKFTMISA